MARSRVKLGLIENLTARKACFKKRRTGLVKKVNEFTTLCGVRAFLMIFNPFEQNQVTVWPSEIGVHEELRRFYEMPELDRTKKMLNHESYLRWRISKLTEQSRRLRAKNNNMELDYLMYRIHRDGGIHNLSHYEQETALFLASEKMKAIRTRIDLLRSAPLLPPDPFPPLFMYSNGGNKSSQAINFGGFNGQVGLGFKNMMTEGNYHASSSNANNNAMGQQMESTNSCGASFGHEGEQLGFENIFLGSYTAPNMTCLPNNNDAGGLTSEQGVPYVPTSIGDSGNIYTTSNIPSVWMGLDATTLPQHGHISDGSMFGDGRFAASASDMGHGDGFVI
ncbi:hypothetical protein K2173_024156 [Erythroxylum novogranatense]|uniref:MADS-box domain-containing protein n=1 Tax=Erythroxylum novogranatense TaxID=1862640 RepID=A0AAV8UH17_9ROSI|nr:hypothetical protein K2173_024156 [Erythroxylum novogranatense]